MNLHTTTLNFVVSTYIDKVFTNKQDFVLDLRESLCYCSPAEIDSTLQNLGWERLDFDSNGWQQDTWYWYANPNYDFQLTMEYSGFYGDLTLYRRDCDEMEESE